jgi:hypothetical protein
MPGTGLPEGWCRTQLKMRKTYTTMNITAAPPNDHQTAKYQRSNLAVTF